MSSVPGHGRVTVCPLLRAPPHHHAQDQVEDSAKHTGLDHGRLSHGCILWRMRSMPVGPRGENSQKTRNFNVKKRSTKFENEQNFLERLLCHGGRSSVYYMTFV